MSAGAGPWGLIASFANALGNTYSSNNDFMRRNQLEAYRKRQPQMVYSEPMQQPQQYTGPGKTAGDISEAMLKPVGGDPIRNYVLQPSLKGEEALMNPAQAPIMSSYMKDTGPYSSLQEWMKYRTRRS